MATIVQPVLSDVADLMTYKTRQTLTATTGAGSTAADIIKTENEKWFAFVAFRGMSNYDGAVRQRAVVGASTGAAASAIYPAVIPNNFSVMVRVNNDEQLMDQPMQQAQICSTGYRAGVQSPFPILFPPLTSFQIILTWTAPFQLTTADTSVARSMVIDFGLFGYSIPSNKLRTFVDAYPEIAGKPFAALTEMRTAPQF